MFRLCCISVKNSILDNVPYCCISDWIRLPHRTYLLLAETGRWLPAANRLLATSVILCSLRILFLSMWFVGKMISCHVTECHCDILSMINCHVIKWPLTDTIPPVIAIASNGASQNQHLYRTSMRKPLTLRHMKNSILSELNPVNYTACFMDLIFICVVHP